MSIYMRSNELHLDSSLALSSILRARNDQNVILVDAIVVSVAARSTAAGGTLVAKVRRIVATVTVASVAVAEIPVDRVQRLTSNKFGL